MTNREDIQFLQQLRSFLTHTTWTKGSYARTKFRNRVSPFNTEAHSWCISGAVIKLSHRSDDPVNQCVKTGQRIRGLLSKHLPQGYDTTLAKFNDHPNTALNDIHTLIDKAIQEES